MPVTFGDIPPYCPVSRDQPVGPTWAPPIRTTVPHAHDLASALAAVNILRSIVIGIVSAKIINNVYTPPPWPPRQAPADRFRDKRKHARFRLVDQTRRKYKYYAVDENGKKDKTNWVMTERIEKLVWYDRGFKQYLIWHYGDKGEGEPTGPAR